MALTVVSKRYGMPAYKFGYYRVMAIVERDMGGGGIQCERDHLMARRVLKLRAKSTMRGLGIREVWWFWEGVHET